MFLVVGKQMYQRDTLIAMLEAIGVSNSEGIVGQIERKGKAEVNGFRIMYVR